MLEQQLTSLEEELKPYKSLLGSASDTIIENDVSSYPIFVLHKQIINIGVPLNTDKISGAWSVSASSLEEFATKQLIEMDKVKGFKSVYKDPTAFICLFVIEESGATFVFIPRY